MADKYKNKYRSQTARAQWWDYGNNAAYFITICTHNREHFFGKINNDQMHLSSLGKIAEQCFNKLPENFSYIYLDEFVVMPDHMHAIVVIDKQDMGNIDDTVGTRLIASPQYGSPQNGSPQNDEQIQNPDSIQNPEPLQIPKPLLPQQLQNPEQLQNPDPLQHPQQIKFPQSFQYPEPKLYPQLQSQISSAKQLSKTNMGGITGNKNPMLYDNLSRAIRWYKGRVTFECRKIEKYFEWQSRFHDHIIRNETEYQRIKKYIQDNPKNWNK